MRGVDIEWWHGDHRVSRRAARDLLDAFGDVGTIGPALCTEASRGRSLVFSAVWTGSLDVRQVAGGIRSVNSAPRDETHPELTEVGAGYGVGHRGESWVYMESASRHG
jgi:hypothetical protein